MENENLQDGTVKKTYTATVPKADIDFAKVVKNVSEKWQTTPQITLIWTTSGSFTDKATLYNKIIDQKLTAQGGRTEFTGKLKAINKEIDGSIKYVKGYIFEKYGKENAESYYPQFGIIRVGNGFKLPVDNDNRSKSLKLMVEAIVNNGFTDNKYGKDYWTKIKTQFDELLGITTATDATISENVGDKKVLNALINVIKGNYPDTSKQELRTWGFQKEKY